MGTPAWFQVQRAMPMLECADLGRSIAFYKDMLGFSAATWGEPATFAIVQRGTVTIALNVVASPCVSPRTWAAYVYVRDVDALHAELKSQGVALPHDPVTQTDYACRDFTIDDPDGHLLAFGQVMSPDVLGPGLSDRIGRDHEQVAASQPALSGGPWTGGCQCGAVRFRIESLGRASHCNCRMCQKAFGAIGGTLVTAVGLTWTRGGPRHFQSSDKVQRGFCGDCGTSLIFEVEGGSVDVAIPTFDRAGEIVPVIQLDPSSRLPWAETLPGLPTPAGGELIEKQGWYASIASRQHPDHDTATWPAPERPR